MNKRKPILPKDHPVRPIEEDFLRSMQAHLKKNREYVTELSRQIKAGRPPRDAVHDVFKKRNIRGAIVKLTLDAVMKGIKLGTKHGKYGR